MVLQLIGLASFRCEPGKSPASGRPGNCADDSRLSAPQRSIMSHGRWCARGTGVDLAEENDNEKAAITAAGPQVRNRDSAFLTQEWISFVDAI